jgi:PPOX class probable F420-dependent enzyme
MSHPRYPGQAAIIEFVPNDERSQPDPHLLAAVAAGHSGAVVTLKRDGRPQISTVGYAYAPGGSVRVSITDSRAKTRNLRRDPRVSLYVPTEGLATYVVVEGIAQLTPVAADPNDATVDALVDLYRTLAGEHPDWDEYRAAMVADGRLVLSFEVDHAYGFAP